MSEQANNAGEMEAFDTAVRIYWGTAPMSDGYRDTASYWFHAAWKARGEQDVERIAELESELAEFRSGEWLRADDYRRNVKELDAALNGSSAERPALIDILAQVECEQRRIGMPIITALRQASPVGEPVDYEQLEREHLGDADKHTGIYAPPAVSANIVPEGWQLMDMGWLRSMMHVNFLRCYPNKSHEAISAEIDRVLGAAPKPGEQP